MAVTRVRGAVISGARSDAVAWLTVLVSTNFRSLLKNAVAKRN